MDIVNEFFHRHYPSPEAIKATDRRWNGIGEEIKVPGFNNAFPEIVCADGLKMSVQGHYGAYSHPRDDFADEYRSVEILCPVNADPLFLTYGRKPEYYDGIEELWAYCPVELVCRIIEAHGGIAKAAISERAA